MNDLKFLENIDKKLSVIIALLINYHPENSKKTKIEVILANLGFKAPEIALLINKNVGAVQKILQRYRK